MSSKIVKVISLKEKIRLDVYLSDYFPDYSRNYFQKLIREQKVKIGEVFPKANYLVKREEIIEVNFLPEKNENIEAQNISLDIIYEDKDIIGLNKPAGMVVHPACGHRDGTLVNALLYYARDSLAKDKKKSSSWKEFVVFEDNRPGIVHRLDKDTSGLILVAKTKTAQFFLAKQFQERKVKKTYWALVAGELKDKKGEIIAPIGRAAHERKKMAVGAPVNKEAITRFKVLKRFKCFTLLEVKPKTGRTHQIRVHFAYIGYPILGDREYSTKWNVGEKKVKRQLLHACELEFLHPERKKRMKITAPLSDDFKEILEILEKNYKY
ncbi:RluA family pseudouridine synthase [bacterium]|nr:RluA family pseudouridine synthase [bacterium]